MEKETYKKAKEILEKFAMVCEFAVFVSCTCNQSIVVHLSMTCLKLLPCF